MTRIFAMALTLFGIAGTATTARTTLAAVHIADNPVADPSADPATDLVQRVHDQATQPEETALMTMRLIEAGGKVRERRARYAQRQTSAGSSTSARLIRFSAPPEMNGSGVLTIERSGQADDQWLYLPAYHTSRKVPANSRTDRYMGTDFAFEDVSADKIAANRYATMGSARLGDRTYSKIEQTPRDRREVSSYGRKMLFIDPERLLIGRIDLYDRSGTLIKQLEGSGAVRIGTVWRWSQMAMTDLRIRHRTVIDYSDRQIGSGAGADLFTVRSLERGR